MAWQGARLRPSRYSASGGSRRPQRKIEHRSLPPASIAASDSVRTERKGERRPLAPRRSGMSPNASHRVRPGLSSAASLITTLLISFDQEVLNQHLNLVTPEYPFFESPWGPASGRSARPGHAASARQAGRGEPSRPCRRSGRSNGPASRRPARGTRRSPPPDPQDSTARPRARAGGAAAAYRPRNGLVPRAERPPLRPERWTAARAKPKGRR